MAREINLKKKRPLTPDQKEVCEKLELEDSDYRKYSRLEPPADEGSDEYICKFDNPYNIRPDKIEFMMDLYGEFDFFRNYVDFLFQVKFSDGYFDMKVKSHDKP